MQNVRSDGVSGRSVVSPVAIHPFIEVRGGTNTGDVALWLMAMVSSPLRVAPCS
jgi:hypothetical protein